jgi:endonuclease/exonuclease/phosphatase family metal-dependent hydrolase
MKKWGPRAATALAVSYVVGLVVAILLLRFGGERFLVTTVALYLPRIGFLVPLPFATIALLVFGPRRLLYSQVVAALLVLFPIMGFGLPRLLPSARAERVGFRALSFNVDSMKDGPDRVAAAIEAEQPDVVLLQEYWGGHGEFVDRLRRTFGTVHVSGQFVLATRFPMLDATDPERLLYYGKSRSPRFMRYVLETPLGPVAVYSVHPVSPRFGFYSLRGEGLRYEILSGRLFSAANAGPMREDTGLRIMQVRTISSHAKNEAFPVLVAGDTNLPSLSPALSEHLSWLTDGFGSAGSGFGYTFPSQRPWMRIDRILSSPSLGFSSFKVSCRGVSDHLCVVADVQSAK